MRLKHIKLAGFKSFVDPTKVHFEQQMTAIVGPNGCGKSNIIDAVRWVLGESSAKNLRGDDMTDVIFNGAASRKPVGQASVELVFDNSSGRISGSLADRQEVSIRRVVNRDGINTYYLNGSKCRRKDITDIFLGTGLGPRSYAIIEQGTISRLIESKPHELRTFIEEAAGISKYKERRRESENSIRHTRENLDRLTDIRLELGVQIDKLHQQAEAAKRYKTLKNQERTFKAELSVLKWQQFNETSQHFQHKFTSTTAEIAAIGEQQKQQNISLFMVKQQIALCNEKITELQQKKLHLSNDITRLEQTIKHEKQKSIATAQTHKINQQQLLNDQQSLEVELQKRMVIELQLQEKKPKLLTLENQLKSVQQKLVQLTNSLQSLDQQWQIEHLQATENTARLALAENNITMQQTLLSRTSRQKEHLVKTLTETETVDLIDINQKKQQRAHLHCQHQALALELSYTEQKLLELHSQLQSDYQQLAKAQGILETQNNNHLQLQGQQNEKSDWQIAQAQWLNQHKVNSNGSLFNNITVENGWERAVEVMLSEWLSAVCVDALPNDLALDNILLIKEQGNKTLFRPGTLGEKIVGLPNIFPFLNDIYVAENIEQARLLLPSLGVSQSVVCKDTTWLGHDFLCKGTFKQSTNYLQRHENIKQLANKITEQEQAITELKVLIRQKEQEIEELKSVRQSISQQLKRIEQETNELNQVVALAEQQHQNVQSKRELLQIDLAEMTLQLAHEQHLLEQHQHELSLLNQNKLPPSEITTQREQNQYALANMQSQIQQWHDERHQLAIAIEKLNNEYGQQLLKINSLQTSIMRLKEQEIANQQLAQSSMAPLKNDEAQLQHWLKQMSAVDHHHQSLQNELAQAQERLNALEHQHQFNVDHIEKLKEQSNQQQLQAESYRLRAESALEVLADMRKSVDEVIQKLPSYAKESIWQAHIVRLAKDISQLGLINLAAIDEYEQQFERKNYLDQQDIDLRQALATLELVIANIDKESRQKFKLTFEQVNNDLSTLFPKVFSGGKAYLALTDDDMLNAGVTIMAQPPGKKNSTIHLLSGGEKALTALSLVFAIFRLNPAPFCMLDEVDAPLDDANVSRFCHLVQEMSQTVQFIYISHNKIAMEMASHLTGVTMFEPGVSKMVAVDIDEAVAMAEVV